MRPASTPQGVGGYEEWACLGAGLSLRYAGSCGTGKVIDGVAGEFGHFCAFVDAAGGAIILDKTFRDLSAYR